MSHWFAQLTGFFEDCWGLFQSSGSKRTGTVNATSFGVECDLLEGIGGESEGPPSRRGPLTPPWWGQTLKSTAAQRGGAQLRELLRGSMWQSLLPFLSFPQ